MPNGKRRRFSAKENFPTNERIQIDESNSSFSNEKKQKRNIQTQKLNKLKSNFFGTGSNKQASRLDILPECESSHGLHSGKPASSDKEITASSSNIDFYNILNISNYNNIDIPTSRKRSRKNQMNMGGKKDEMNVSRHDKFLRQHRMKVRSPKRRPISPEVSKVEKTVTESLDAIDWDQELEETIIRNIVDNSNEEHLHSNKNYYNHRIYSSIVANLTNQTNSIQQNNSANEEIDAGQTHLAAQFNLASSRSNMLANQYSLTQKSSFNQRSSNDHSLPSDLNPITLSCATNRNIASNQAIVLVENNPEQIVTDQCNPTHLNYSCTEHHSSHNSFDAMCRICHGGESLSDEMGRMISACGCRGTVGRVHVKCLERWLTESGKSRCELCGTHYSTRRVHKYGFPKAVAIWVLSHNAKQLMVDSLGIILMSPLAVVAAWLSGRTLAGLMAPESQQTPWPLASTFLLACMTLVCYYCWIVSAVTRHALGWWIWYRSQYEVHLQLQDNDD